MEEALTGPATHAVTQPMRDLAAAVRRCPRRRFNRLSAGVGLAAALLAACAGTPPALPMAAFRVETSGWEPGGEFCRDFRLSDAQAAWFFGRAREVSMADLHASFENLPCWVRGSAAGPGGAWRWEIRAGGTAKLVTPEGDVRLYGCKRCDEVLRGDEEPPAPHGVKRR